MQRLGKIDKKWVTATENLNDVLSGAKERLGQNTDEKKLKVINPLDTTSKEKSSLVNNQTDKKKR